MERTNVEFSYRYNITLVDQPPAKKVGMMAGPSKALIRRRGMNTKLVVASRPGGPFRFCRLRFLLTSRSFVSAYIIYSHSLSLRCV
jgi:hypothetical protein